MIRVYAACAGVVLLTCLSSVHAQEEADCRGWGAVADVVQGRVEIRRAGRERWQPLSEGTLACHGDSIRTYPYSRAQFAVRGEVSFKLDEDTTGTLEPPADDTRFWLNLLRGAVHIISRQQGAMRIVTPYWNAGLRGTELMVSVTDTGAAVSVYEGEVVVENDSGRVEIPPSFRLVADADSFSELLAVGREELEWALYYPTIISGRLPDPDSSAAGDLAGLVARAQSRMIVGRILEAESDLAAALRLQPDHADALALSCMISVIGKRADARALADAALASDSRSIAALLAHSYVLQRNLDLTAARDAARAALDIDVANALAAARLAELEFGLGDYASAREHADLALTLDPGLALAHTVRGFVATAAGNLDAARERFETAVRLEPHAPTARLGLSELLLRDKSIDAGRAEAESAVAAQPNDGVIRAYGAKAYSEEGRRPLAGAQIEIAKSLDMDDSTPWTYEAIVAYDENRPILAVENLDQAFALSQDYSPFRSTLTLDQDLGTRAAPYGGIYESASYERGALVTGAYSVTAYPTEFSGYRLLADAYSRVPRQQMTRVNLSTQAKLRQPVNLTPLAPELFEADISMMASAGPAPLIHPESRSRYAQMGFQAQISAVMGNDDTVGEHVIGTYVQDAYSLSFGQLMFRTDGLRDNNGFEHKVFDVSSQIRPGLSTNLQFDLRSVSSQYGDIDILFDRANFDPMISQSDELDSFRFGVSHRLSGNLEVLGTFMLENGEFLATSPGFASVYFDTAAAVSEVQFAQQLPAWRVVYGLRRTDQDDLARVSALIPGTMPAFFAEIEQNSDRSHVLGYTYADRQVGEDLFLTLGLSVDRLEAFVGFQSAVNPKLGLIWRFGSNSYLRAAALKTTLGLVPSRQIIRPSLEPVHVAGFNQYYFGVEGERSEQYGIGIDHVLGPELRFGIERRERRLAFPGRVLSPNQIIEFVARETTDEASMYWTPSAALAFTFAWQHEHFRNDGPADAIPEAYRYMRTHRLPVSATLFAGRSVRVEVSGTYIQQEGDFAFGSPGPGQQVMEATSEFAVFDLTFGYKLPNRQGSVELGLKNMTDEEFMYQDTDPYAPRLFYDRFFYSRFSLQF